MCYRRAPQHPWCDCADPDARDANGHLLCPHHVWIRPDGAMEKRTADERKHLDATVASIHRPGPYWVHCREYRAQFQLADGRVVTGFEKYCPAAHELAALHGRHDTFYAKPFPWDGLCAHCDKPGRGIPLHLVPLQPKTTTTTTSILDEEDVAAGGEFQLPDGSALESDVQERILHGRSKHAGGEAVYVHIVDAPVMGKWEVDIDKSAIYLLPGAPEPVAAAAAAAEAPRTRTKVEERVMPRVRLGWMVAMGIDRW
ncbi:hypothetical protein VTK56DRAFT_6615 [Thermocarpiscus australiensis]